MKVDITTKAPSDAAVPEKSILVRSFGTADIAAFLECLARHQGLGAHAARVALPTYMCEALALRVLPVAEWFGGHQARELLAVRARPGR